MYRDLGFIRVGRQAHAARRRPRRGRPRLRVPHLRPQADRGLRPRQRAAAERVLRRVSRHDRERRAAPAARLRRRARQVDGAHLRRGPRDPPRQHAPGRPPARSRACAARPVAARRMGASPQAAGARFPTASEQRSAQPQPGHPRWPGSRPGARLPEGHRVRRRRPPAPDHRHRQHLDGDDALQLPPAPARREGEGGRAGRGRHADGVQHRRDLGRDHDGHRGDEDLADQPRGDRGLDRAGRARAHVRRRGGPVGLRQDDPRLRDGARPARRAQPDALRRLDRARPLARQGRDDPGRLRGHRRARRRRPHRRRADRPREPREPRRRRVRRPVHRQHDGDGLRGARHLADGQLDGARRRTARRARSPRSAAGS